MPIELDDYYYMEEDSPNQVLNISSIVPCEFEHLDWKSNSNIYKPIFSDSLSRNTIEKLGNIETDFESLFFNFFLCVALFTISQKLFSSFAKKIILNLLTYQRERLKSNSFMTRTTRMTQMMMVMMVMMIMINIFNCVRNPSLLRKMK